MSAGTKVSVAIIVLFGVVLGVYYAFGGPPQKDADTSGELSPALEDPAGAMNVAPTVGPADPTEAASSPEMSARDPILASHGASAGTQPQTAQIPEDVWVLRAPLLQDEPRTAPPIVQYTDYIVREDDSLWTIADGWFGEPARWQEIADANPQVNPDRLRVGQRLRLPATTSTVALNRAAAIERPTTPVTPRTNDRFYTVRSGDTLTHIAKLQYRDTDRWRVIYEANRAAIGWDPDRLKVGMRLRIPPA